MNLLLRLAASPPSGGNGGGGTSHPIAFYLVGSFVVIVSLVFCVKPDWQWKSTRWQFKNPDALEPSAKGLAMRRVSSGLVAVVGIVILVVVATRS